MSADKVTLTDFLAQPIRINRMLAEDIEFVNRGRTLFDKVFSPTPEEIAAREANETHDIEPAKGYVAPSYVLKEPKGWRVALSAGCPPCRLV